MRFGFLEHHVGALLPFDIGALARIHGQAHITILGIEISAHAEFLIAIEHLVVFLIAVVLVVERCDLLEFFFGAVIHPHHDAVGYLEPLLQAREIHGRGFLRVGIHVHGAVGHATDLLNHPLRELK